jgi:hypothetical protein
MKGRFFTIKDFAEKHGWPTESGLRNLIFRREVNGFDAVVLKVGSRWLVDSRAFESWVRQFSVQSTRERSSTEVQEE